MRRSIVALLFVTAGLVPVVHAASVADFMDFSLRAADNSLLLPGRLYVPPGAGSGGPRPLILFLHGAGESGTNNVAQINGNIDNLLAEAKQRGAFLYAPQTSSNWSSTTITSRVATMLDRALVDYNVDSSRQYATGLSMGGGGVWNMINRYDERFAAAVPICGVSPGGDFLAANLLDESIWAFHARNDTVVSVTTSRNVINSVLNAASEAIPTYPSTRDTTTLLDFHSQTLDLHYLELPTGGHGIWPFVYAQEPMYDWLFAHGAVPEPATMLLVAMVTAMAITGRCRTDRRYVFAATASCR